jgi:hypothetical protein
MENSMADATLQTSNGQPGDWRTRPPDERFGAWYAERWEPSRRLATQLVGHPEDGADLAASVLVDVGARWLVTGIPNAPAATCTGPSATASPATSNAATGIGTPRVASEASRRSACPEAAVVDRDAVEGVLARLPADERRTVALLYLADLPASETARELGTRPASVRSRVHRSRRRLASTAA